jgi:hydroxymethylpyrimidine/phosphomethylpyrimidine kinase
MSNIDSGHSSDNSATTNGEETAETPDLGQKASTELLNMQHRYDEELDHNKPSRLRVLSIEGSDPIGGAGTMADMKAFTAQGVFGYAVMTSVLAQNTQGVADIVNVEPSFLLAQLKAVSDDADIDSMKIGMLGTPQLVDTVRQWLTGLLEHYRAENKAKPTVVLDPVMYAKSGDRLLTAEAEQALVSLIPLADIITPNAMELSALDAMDNVVGAHQSDKTERIATQAPLSYEAMEQLAQSVANRFDVVVYVKGGALALNGARECTDILATPTAGHKERPTVTRITGAAVSTSNVHGTGDTLSSTLAALRPQCTDWVETAKRAKEWMTGAIAAADDLHVGHGHGPVDFTWQHSPTGLSFTEDYWRRSKEIRERIRTMPFLERMLDGTLPLNDFSFYLHQDDLYLNDYTSLLALASSLAQDPHERAFFASAASYGLEEGLSFHRQWYREHGFSTQPAPMSDTTAAYIGHEHRFSDGGSYCSLVAALMPCYWIYSIVGQEMGRQMQEHRIDLNSHPYGLWIDMYCDAGFASLTFEELRICDKLAAYASMEDYNRMMDAALGSTEHEYRFFNQALSRR